MLTKRNESSTSRELFDRTMYEQSIELHARFSFFVMDNILIIIIRLLIQSHIVHSMFVIVSS